MTPSVPQHLKSDSLGMTGQSPTLRIAAQFSGKPPFAPKQSPARLIARRKGQP
jgi:hypothetical protein